MGTINMIGTIKRFGTIKKYSVAIGLLGVTTLQAMAQYAGRVFVDENKNGILDQREKVLRHVPVSDGLHVVLTDGNGVYRLPGHVRARFLFMTTPSGYKTDNAYYHRIQTNRTRYDFPVSICQGGIQVDGTHRFIHISDTEIHDKESNRKWADNLRDYAANEKIAFIVHTGDICYEVGLNNHIQLLNTSLMEDTQVFYGIGNHDLVKGAYGEELFEKLYGPTYYSFDVGNVHYMMTPMLHGDHAPGYTKEDVYRWMKNDLACVDKGKSVIVFNHSLPEDTTSFRYGISATEYVDLPASGLKAWLYGHWHVNHVYKNKKENRVNEHEAAGVYAICTSTPACGGIDHAPSAFRVLTVDAKGGLKSEFRYSYLPASLQIASISEEEQTFTLPSGNIPLSVNAYSTVSPISSMRYWCEYEGRKILPVKTIKQQSDFNWYAEIPFSPQWERKRITVIVEAFFRSGEVKQSRRSFLYAKKENQGDIPQRKAEEKRPRKPEETSQGKKQETGCPLWVRNVGASVFMSAPLVDRNRLFVATVDDNESGKAAVICMNAQNGEINWRYPVRGSVRSSIAIADGKIFAQDVHGYLYAIEAETGTLVWEKNLRTGSLPPLNDGLTATSGIVYAGAGESLCALKTSTGEQIWKNEDWTRGEGCVATLSLHRNILIGHANWKGLYANDATTGRLLWENKDRELKYRSASVAWVDDRIYLLSSQSLFIMEPQTGEVIVRKKLGYSVDVNSTPLVTETEIIFGTANRGVVALNRQTLEEKWNFKTASALIYTSPYSKPPSATVETTPVLVGNTICIGASDGVLYMLNRTDGKLLWKHSTGIPIFTTVAISERILYVADFGGNVYAFICN